MSEAEHPVIHFCDDGLGLRRQDMPNWLRPASFRELVTEPVRAPGIGKVAPAIRSLDVNRTAPHMA